MHHQGVERSLCVVEDLDLNPGILALTLTNCVTLIKSLTQQEVGVVMFIDHVVCAQMRKSLTHHKPLFCQGRVPRECAG